MHFDDFVCVFRRCHCVACDVIRDPRLYDNFSAHQSNNGRVTCERSTHRLQRTRRTKNKTTRHDESSSSRTIH